MKYLFLLMALVSLAGCGNSLEVLKGATHARGTVHIEGYLTDTQGEVNLCKVPPDYTPEQAAKFCNGED